MDTPQSPETVCTRCQTPNPAAAIYCHHCAGRLPLPPGEHFAGRYTIRAPAGSAGIGQRYHITETGSDTSLMLVELRDNRGWSDQARAFYRTEFIREAEQLADLPTLSALPTLYQPLTRRDDRLFFVLADLPETTLREALARRKRPYPPDVVIDWGLRLGELLAALGDHASLTLDPDHIGVVGPSIRLPDLGIIRSVQTEGIPISPQDDGFTAPEHLARQREPRSALYSLAAVMAHLLTNQAPPPPSPQIDALSQANPRIPLWLSHLIAINLSAAPYDRYASVEDVVADLRRQQVTDLVVCRACGAENRRTEIYCQTCARALLQSVRVCEVCEKEMPTNARFCPNCGIKVG